MTKKQFFKDKAQTVQYQIWDIEFKIAKARNLREEIRQDRDRAIENANILAERMKEEKNNDEKKRLQSEHDTLLENVTRYEKQMQMVDDEINGGNPTEYSPDGIGLLERIRSYTELKEMIKDYANKI